MLNNKNKGYTLIELIIAVAVFSVVVLTMTTVASMAIQSQRKSFGLQGSQETSRYIMESLTKEIRMSKVNTAAGVSSVLNITTPQGRVYEYTFDSVAKRLERQYVSGPGAPKSPLFLSSDDFEVTGNFYIRKSAFPFRVAVTVVMQVKSKTAKTKAEEQIKVYLQSTISSRVFD